MNDQVFISIFHKKGFIFIVRSSTVFEMGTHTQQKKKGLLRIRFIITAPISSVETSNIHEMWKAKVFVCLQAYVGATRLSRRNTIASF
jgi:hypothetical protein